MVVGPPCSNSLSLLLRLVLLDEISLPFDPASSQRAFLTDFSISHPFWHLENNHAEETEALGCFRAPQYGALRITAWCFG